ncbi:MAG: alpha-galactosidase [Actinomycetota bacterium]
MAEPTVLTSEALAVVLVDDGGGMPEIASVGPRLDGFVPGVLAQPVPKGTLDAGTALGLVSEHAAGHGGRPGLVGARPDGSGWSPVFTRSAVEVDAASVRYVLADPLAELELTLDLRVGHTLVISAALTNTGESPYGVQRLSPSVPVPAGATDLMTFGGRWCMEFQPDRQPFEGLTVVENRRGRTSHQRLPAAFAGTSAFGEQHGEVWGVQLAWSGNFELAAERLADGRRHVQVGELLSPGEVVLAPGETYTAPDVVVAWSDAGLTPASQAFHRQVRADLPATTATPRPVLLNTWEAVYFDHRLDVLEALAERAAAVGVERFVLDDGWFGGRRDDTAGLGDWWVSEAVWPQGLGPIVDHVTGLGMEFGLWVEPEMVNPDSDLYRAHPEWALTTEGYEPVLGRHQLVLDFGRAEVREHLFTSIDTLLSDYDIAYLKWDMNRDVIQGSHHGHAGAHGHVVGLYQLLDRLRAEHPTVEIESCSSGGGRADMGILRRTDRIWTSDCNDALERQLIQRGCSMLLPPEVMGAHIGPDRAHTTNRRQDVGFRAATALFGHLGIEWNLLSATGEELDAVTAAVAVHRRLRALLHSGDTVRVDHADDAALVHGVVSGDHSRALFAYVQLSPSRTMVPSPFLLAGLDPDAVYRVDVVHELGSAVDGGRVAPAWLSDGAAVTGAQLMRRGMQPPALHAESALLLELTRV